MSELRPSAAFLSQQLGADKLGLGLRFWSKVYDDPSGCWIWLSSCDFTGYGKYSIKRRQYRAHRLAYEAMVGPIAVGLQVDHLCRVRNCCNPAHLEPVTARENVLRSNTPDLLRERAAKITGCPHGHPYDQVNTYWRDGRFRECKTCRNTYKKAWNVRKKAKDTPTSNDGGGVVSVPSSFAPIT